MAKVLNYKGNKMVAISNFTDQYNECFSKARIHYNVKKITEDGLADLLDNVVDGCSSETSMLCKAATVDDAKKLIKKINDMAEGSYTRAVTRRIQAVILNRALRELDPEVENLFPPAENTRPVFTDTDEYAISYDNLPKQQKKQKPAEGGIPKELPLNLENMRSNIVEAKSQKTLSELAEILESNSELVENYKKAVDEAETTLRDLQKQKEQYMASMYDVMKQKVEAEEEAIRQLSEQLAEDKSYLLEAA